MPTITPTVGRKVYFYADALQVEPHDATIIKVWAVPAQAHPGSVVNLLVTDPLTGAQHLRQSVRAEDSPVAWPHFRWMPYQVGQAKPEAKPTLAPGALTNEQAIGLTSYASMERIARVCHEVNRAYCEALGDHSQPAWDDAPSWQRESARMGVDLHLMGNFGPEASHISWMRQKLADGWVYGDVKNADAKTHPCIRPFSELPVEQQAKDFIFRAVVHALRPTSPIETTVYTDGTTATGTAPLPDLSPAQQRAGDLLTEDPDHAPA